MRELLILGQLNDGVETPGSDVDRLLQYAQVAGFTELGDRLQRPGFTVVQGDAGTTDASTGIAIKDGLMTVLGFHWTRLSTWRKTGGTQVLTVWADFHGCHLSLMSTKRPASLTDQQKAVFDDALGNAVHEERAADRVVLLFMDTNDPDPQTIMDQTWLNWNAPYPTSVVGIFTSGSVQMLACSSLKRIGEHPPVVGLVKVPLP